MDEALRYLTDLNAGRQELDHALRFVDSSANPWMS